MAVLQAKARPNCLTLHRGPPPVHFEGKVYDSEEKVNIKYIGGLRPYIKQEVDLFSPQTLNQSFVIFIFDDGSQKNPVGSKLVKY